MFDERVMWENVIEDRQLAEIRGHDDKWKYMFGLDHDA